MPGVLFVLLASTPSGAAAQLSSDPADTPAARRGRLARLDSTLATVERRLRAQIAHTDSVTNAARRDPGVGIVLLTVADGAPRTLSRAALRFDDAEVRTRVYYGGARDALAAGGADELHRTTVLGVPHEVTLDVVAGDRPLSRTVTVTPAADGHATYVQFVLTAGALEASSWSGVAAGEP
jgi:hypothetical protein